MITFRGVNKFYRVGRQVKVVANSININFPARRAIGIFGKNGAGKSTLLRMISGLEKPSSGEIMIDGSVSWPVGFAGSFHPDLSAAQNIKFIARIYGIDTDMLTDFVKEFAELGPHFYSPFRTYSSGMRARLAFGVSMGIHFDTYLIDEVTSVGDMGFRERSAILLRERLQHSGAIIVSHSMPQMKKMCDCGVVLIDGHARMFDDVGEAIAIHEAAMKGNLPQWARDNA